MIGNSIYRAARAIRGSLKRDAMEVAHSKKLQRVAKSDYKYNTLGSKAKKKLVEKYGTEADKLNYRNATTATNASRVVAAASALIGTHAYKKYKESKNAPQMYEYY